MNDKAVTSNGKVLIDKQRFGYWGNSLGGILGGGYVAQSPDIQRAVLGMLDSTGILTTRRTWFAYGLHFE